MYESEAVNRLIAVLRVVDPSLIGTARRLGLVASRLGLSQGRELIERVTRDFEARARDLGLSV